MQPRPGRGPYAHEPGVAAAQNPFRPSPTRLHLTTSNIFLVTHAEEDKIVQGQDRVLTQDEILSIGALLEELVDYSQMFARANLV